MSKTFFTVDDVLRHLRTYTPIKMGILIALFSIPGVSIQAAQNMDYYDRPIHKIENSVFPTSTISFGQDVSGNAGIEFFMGSTFSVTEQLQAAFNDLCKSKPVALEMEPVFCLIRDGLGEIMAEKVSVSCDAGNKVLNVAYRLPKDMLLSVSKPLNTMDDNYVMFNLFHLRELLISDTADISFLSTYIHKAEESTAQL